MPWPLRYVVEPRRGLSFVRNRAISEARAARADFVAFLDDDEVATAPWLTELLRVQGRYAADVVTGPS
jgi:glycosyltransferase involved in cell wall biosynthesis